MKSPHPLILLEQVTKSQKPLEWCTIPAAKLPKTLFQYTEEIAAVCTTEHVFLRNDMYIFLFHSQHLYIMIEAVFPIVSLGHYFPIIC